MANTVGSITDWMPIVCSDNPTLGFCSSRQAYLYILYSLKPPFELPTYNNRSGVIRECGVELHFEHVNCIPQNEPLASTCRSFTLPSYPDGTSIWYYFSDSCERETATWTSPVFTFSYGTEASLAARLSLGHNWVEAMPPLNYYGIHWDLDLCDPNDLHVPGSQLILAPLAATYLIKWRISIVNGPWPGQFNFAILGSSPFRTVHETIGPSLPAGAPWESTIIGNFLLNGPKTVIFAIQKNTDLVVGFDVHPGTTLAWAIEPDWFFQDRPRASRPRAAPLRHRHRVRRDLEQVRRRQQLARPWWRLAPHPPNPPSLHFHRLARHCRHPRFPPLLPGRHRQPCRRPPLHAEGQQRGAG